MRISFHTAVNYFQFIPKIIQGTLVASPGCTSEILLPKDYFFFVAFLAAFLAGAFLAAFFVAMLSILPLFRFASNLQHECCSYGRYMVLEKQCQEKNAISNDTSWYANRKNQRALFRNFARNQLLSEFIEHEIANRVRKFLSRTSLLLHAKACYLRSADNDSHAVHPICSACS